MMDRLTSLRVFCEIMETGSFAAAAERLGVSAPMASKHIAQLEQASGARLLHRSSRKLSPTEAGKTYYAHCRQALDILEAANAEIHQVTSKPRGLLKISAPVWCANQNFADMLAEYQQRYPEVVVDLHLGNRMVDLVAEGFDLALRASSETSPTLFARPLCDIRFAVVATPEYLSRIDRLRKDGEQVVPGLIAPSYVDIGKIFPARTQDRAAPAYKMVMSTDNSNLSYFALLAGVGMAMLPDWLVAEDIAAGRLIALKTDRQLPHVRLQAVYTSRSHIPLKLRSFIDFFSKKFADQLQRGDTDTSKAKNTTR